MSDDLDQDMLNRFMKEAAQIAGWQHPNILRIYESMQIELIDPVLLYYAEISPAYPTHPSHNQASA
jgi:hypothetical protein